MNDDQNDCRETGRKIPTALPEPPTATMQSPEPLRTNAASAQQHAYGRPIFRSTVVHCHTVRCQHYRRCGAVLRRACAVCVSSVVRRHAQCWRDKSEPKRISLQLQDDKSRAPVNNGACTIFALLLEPSLEPIPKLGLYKIAHLNPPRAPPRTRSTTTPISRRCRNGSGMPTSRRRGSMIGARASRRTARHFG
jgi:hypothetical protein